MAWLWDILQYTLPYWNWEERMGIAFCNAPFPLGQPCFPCQIIVASVHPYMASHGAHELVSWGLPHCTVLWQGTSSSGLNFPTLRHHLGSWHWGTLFLISQPAWVGYQKTWLTTAGSTWSRETHILASYSTMTPLFTSFLPCSDRHRGTSASPITK